MLLIFKHREKASDWKLKKLILSMSKISHEASGRRADYKTVTDSTEKNYPMEFVTHRWVENVVVAKKAKLIWSKIIEVGSYWQQLPKNKQRGIGKPRANTSYEYLCITVKDCLVPVKLLFFEEVAKKILVDLGTAVNHEIQLLQSSKTTTGNQILKFKKEDVRFCAPILWKRANEIIFCQIISESGSETCKKLLDKVLSKLMSYKVITSDTAYHSKSQCSKFVTIIVKENRPGFLNYSKTNQHLDKFMMKFVGASTIFSELCKLFKILLILSHDQDQLERGVSVNKNVLLENQHTTKLTAQRIIHDHMVYHEHEPSNLTITAKFLSHVKQARSKYFKDQKESSMQRVQSGMDVKIK